MSARLLKVGAQGNSSAYVPFAFAGVAAAQSAQGQVIPFVPKAPDELPPPPISRPDTSRGEAAGDARPSAAEVIGAAEAEAARLLEAARAEAANVERQARERGLAAARAEAEAEVSRAAEPLRQQLAQTIEQVAGLRAEITTRAERDLVRLAIEIAKKIVHREVTADGEVALTLARVALARAGARTQARLHLHPEDFAYVAERAGVLTGASSIELVEDRAVGRGGCLVETEAGDTDARVEKQFEEIERSFLGV